jgi:hypothetical protein
MARWMAAQTVIRWARPGLGRRPLRVVQERGVALGMVYLDSAAR